MINPFKLSNNSRWSYNGRTIIVESFSMYNVIWYYLDEWWKTQLIKPRLHKTNIFTFIIKANKYNYV